MDKLDEFVNEILEAKKLPQMSDEVKKQLIVDMRQGLLDQVNRALLAALPDDKTAEFDQLLDQPDISDEQVQQFIIDSGVDIQKVTARTMLQFRDQYLQTAQERRKA